ncbi:hypothetical protein SAMN02745146_3039 [Hymenobacter daecheongensis DSM 21074]|uniref:Uncharacterized protein n=1 Tax=Hymenobacter daecheongensis DSM 21074 TaxID=1121955 RepID=A0A1M6IZZ2_9BACT|nr:hypothetical protein [Hymenobacter daecheongensis]SHJ40045.1 hypothetical protein SAMN02745146_3039 [Hymenobacter daecheongensis DSM 21074]
MARLKPTFTQSCDYCHGDFVPRKRGTQRFCSASCRTTYCKKKREGTLGKRTKLQRPGNELRKSSNSFTEMALASATGALAANAVSQTTEYFVVTQGLVKQVEHLTKLVQQLVVDQANNTRRLGRGTLTMLTKLGVTNEEAWKALNTPFPIAGDPKPVQHALPASKLEEIQLPPLASIEIPMPIDPLSGQGNIDS